MLSTSSRDLQYRTASRPRWPRATASGGDESPSPTGRILLSGGTRRSRSIGSVYVTGGACLARAGNGDQPHHAEPARHFGGGQPVGVGNLLNRHVHGVP
jgi:hypothetical protein